MNETFEMAAKTFQGLEGVLADELTELGAENVEVGRRIVSFCGGIRPRSPAREWPGKAPDCSPCLMPST